MTWANWSLGGGGVLVTGPVRRKGRRQWLLGHREKPARTPVWQAIDPALVETIEAAYQRFAHAEFESEIANQLGSAWLEQLRQRVGKPDQRPAIVLISHLRLAKAQKNDRARPPS
ncbi:MAG: hypothetical protein QM778_04910 [Myxococcales bacterium]